MPIKPQLALAFIALTAPAFAQSSGVSHPPEAPVEDLPPAAAVAPAKPSAAVPQVPAPRQAPADDAGEYRPYSNPAVTLHQRTTAETDPDAGIVTDMPRKPNALPIGTALRARLRAPVDTESTQQNAPFTAELAEDLHDGTRIALPIGSIVEGNVTRVRGGRRFRGAALIHLEAQRIVLPDGTRIPLHAQVVDTDQFAETRIDNEGNIRRKDHAIATLATISAITGAAAVTGAVVGGGVGALVGAGIGAGLSTAVWLKQDRQARLPQDTVLVFSLTDAMDMAPQQDVVRAPHPGPHMDTAAAVAPSPGQAPAPAYSAPQAFVPAN